MERSEAGRVICVIPESANTLSPMLVTVSGITICVKDEHPSKRESFNAVNDAGKDTLCNEEQPLNTSFCISVTVSGIVISVKEEQFLNSPDSNTVTPSGITKDVKAEHPSNAAQPM